MIPGLHPLNLTHRVINSTLLMRQHFLVTTSRPLPIAVSPLRLTQAPTTTIKGLRILLHATNSNTTLEVTHLTFLLTKDPFPTSPQPILQTPHNSLMKRLLLIDNNNSSSSSLKSAKGALALCLNNSSRLQLLNGLATTKSITMGIINSNRETCKILLKLILTHTLCSSPWPSKDSHCLFQRG